ncbi:leucine-rich repeat domain-containing protein [Pseudobacteroides cellulosolvens]|uniref:Leucine-rich repeat-containing protein n=1 Tax=Pseudobacteroides cellulosolvens ATCC 35603 = DSM 2933 TaxID=398512 RepID=A0A0L6JJH4_9FIRM|nr:leucine-rich repeat domain-containing protein [Pseudobacteroides cellulosolvens]KNY26031.1 leucine-rich repeat-containing protein [Pseudobacteroides cellulosolvens ATCC 35603 = DSM 2933]
MLNQKRILSYFLVVVMLLTILSPQALAADDVGSGQTYDEESFYNIFTDREFGKQVLKAIGVDTNNIDWSLVNDNSISSLKEFQVLNNIESLNGLEKLEGLERLVVSDTKIDRFPDEIEKSLTNLKSLSLGGNKTLKIPAFANLNEFSTLSGQAVTMNSRDSIESMANLKILNLCKSKVSDNSSIAKVIDYSKFGNLEQLDISGNNIESLPESIKSLSNLKFLDMGINDIGSIPAGFFENFKNIEKLRMNNCKLSSIPIEVAALSNLKTLDVSYNNIASLHYSDGLVGLCESLDIRGNKITDYSNEFYKAFPNLKYLSATDCGFDKFPEFVTYIENLEYLDIGSNPMGKNVEQLSLVAKLKNLYFINLSNCSIDEFPESLLDLQELHRLDISNNPIKRVPDGDDGIKKLNHLFELHLSNCNLDSFPTEICDLPNLSYLHLSGNDIKKLPESDMLKGKFDNLSALYLESCKLTEFPDIKCLPNLELLNLRNNLICHIPDDTDLSGIKDLYIDLGFNYFTSIPKVFSSLNASNCKVNLYYNYLSDLFSLQLPDCISNISPNCLMLENMPSYIMSGESIDIYDYLSRTVQYNYGKPENISNIKGIVPVEFTVSEGIEEKEGLVDDNGMLKIEKEGTYVITAKLKDADNSNSFAKATATISVFDKDIYYNEEKFKAAFPDEAFGKEVLKALKAYSEDTGIIDYNKVLWDRVTDVTLCSLKELNMSNPEISDLSGLENLTGLYWLIVNNSKIKGFPKGIEDKLPLLRVLSLNENVNTIKIPEFANLTNLVCGNVSGQAIRGSQKIAKDSIKSVNLMKNLRILDLTKTKDLEENVVIADSIDYTNLKNLYSLCIADNGLIEIPKGIEALENLTTLDLSYNPINTLPSYFGTVFKDLHSLSLYNCNLDLLPECLTKMQELYRLDLGVID